MVIVVVAPALLTVYFDSGEFESAVKQLGGRLKSQIESRIKDSFNFGKTAAATHCYPAFPLSRPGYTCCAVLRIQLQVPAIINH